MFMSSHLAGSAHSSVFAARCVSGPGDFSGRFFWMVLRFVAQPGVEHVKVWVLDLLMGSRNLRQGGLAQFGSFHKWLSINGGIPKFPKCFSGKAIHK
jgi:hypothetical protein